MQNDINLIALEAMIKKAKYFQERFPNAIIAGIVFSQPNGICILPTDDSDDGMIELQNVLLSNLIDGKLQNKTLSSNDN